MPMSPDNLTAAIRASWDKETTTNPDEWDAETAAERGQCVPTALVVQDQLGGDLERLATEYQGGRETHYRNVVDGEVIDLTRAQYPEDQVFEPAPVEGDTREYVLGNENTRRRYQLLATRVEALLTLEA